MRLAVDTVDDEVAAVVELAGETLAGHAAHDGALIVARFEHGRLARHDVARHLVVGRDALLLREQLERGAPSVTGHHVVVLAVGTGGDGEVLQQAYARDARGERRDRRGAPRAAHVTPRRPQLRQRDQQQGLRDGVGVLGIHGDGSVQGKEKGNQRRRMPARSQLHVMASSRGGSALRMGREGLRGLLTARPAQARRQGDKAAGLARPTAGAPRRRGHGPCRDP